MSLPTVSGYLGKQTMLSATVPSPLPLPKQQLHPLPPKSSGLQSVSLRFPRSLLTSFPHCMSLCARSVAAGEYTLFAGFLGAAGAGLPASSAPQLSLLPRLLLAAARLRRHHRCHYHHLLHPPATSVFDTGLLSSAAGCGRMRGVSGCRSDYGSSQPPAALCRHLPSPRGSGCPRSHQLRLVTDQSKGLAVNLSCVPHISFARETLLFSGKETDSEIAKEII